MNTAAMQTQTVKQLMREKKAVSKVARVGEHRSAGERRDTKTGTERQGQKDRDRKTGTEIQGQKDRDRKTGTE
jgi:hypothetical protein